MRRWVLLIMSLTVALLVSACGPFGGSSDGGSGQTPAAGGSDTAPDQPSGEKPADKPATDKPAGAPACPPGQAADYFPYHQGTKAKYAGLGNEYAAFKIDVIHEAGNKVEWRLDNGGTVMAEVFQVTPQQVVRIYREGEAYDNNPRLNAPPNISEPILKAPIQVGTQWTVGTTTYKITSINDTVQALNNQTLNCVVVVEAQDQGPLMRFYYHQQYGQVLRDFDPAGSSVESRLATFTP